MTTQERAAIEAASDGRPLAWRPDADPRFVRLRAQPCPLLETDTHGRASCSVWDVRPYNCRRFLCGRVGDEPYETAPDGTCRNLTDRVDQSLRFAEFYRTSERFAQRTWAEGQGWSR